MFDRAFHTLEDWSRSSEKLAERRWASMELAILDSPLSFQLDDWDGSESLRRYRSRGLDALKRAFSSYCDQLESEARDAGLPLKADGRTNPYRWAVRFQVLGDRPGQIAEDEGTHQQSVQRDVAALLKHLDIPRRRYRPGPRSMKSQH